MSDLQDQAIRQHCKALRMPTIGGQFDRLAETAVREKQSHLGYLEALLSAEMEERESRAIARLLGGVACCVEIAWAGGLRRDDGCSGQAARSTGTGAASGSPKLCHPSTFRMVI